MRVLKIVSSEWRNESRDKRELSVCEELGMETAVLAKGNPGDRLRKDEVSGFQVYRESTRPLGTDPHLNPLNRVISLFTWAGQARKLAPDIISGHDLIGLLIGWMSNVGHKKKAKLVYDSHEFELGRNSNRGKLATWCVGKLERFLMKRCAFSMMVNDSIADEVQKIHRLKERPVVVRNIAPYWELDPERTAAARKELLDSFSQLPENPFLIMHHGAVTTDRGIEEMIELVSRLPHIVAVILGNPATIEYLDGLKRQCREKGVEGRMIFHPAVPVEILRHYVSAADLSVDAGSMRCVSYRFSLPNKFFESIQSETPLVFNQYPDTTKIMEHYQLGIVANTSDPDTLETAVERMRTDKKYYAACKEHLKLAKKELCWENEKEVLKCAYRNIMA